MARWFTNRGAANSEQFDGAEAIETAEEADRPSPAQKPGWRGTRLVALIAAVAVVSLLLGIVVMQFIVSPAELAARTAAPEAGPVTAAVEERVIENTVVARGEVTYAGAVDAQIEVAGMEERPVVTGRVPEVGAELQAGDVALEVAGRPVIVLSGGLPAYRDLRVGLRGPDVAELKKALGAFDLWAGDPGTDMYDADTAIAVGALYDRVGYEAPTGGDEAQEALRAAERGVRDAEAALGALGNAGGAEATAANDALFDAQEALAKAQTDVLPTLPASEVLVLSELPRRVDDVTVARGDVLQGSAMQVSGATLAITATVAKQDAELMKEGQVATFTGPDGQELEAKVQSVAAPEKGKQSGTGGEDGGEGSGGGDGGDGGGETSDASRFVVTLIPDELTAEQVDALRDTNVRVRVPVESTDGAVLAVPIAALSAGSGGEDRIELALDEAGRKAEGADTVTIDVQAGLAADGFVEIASDDDRVAVGTKVVVGK